ncbi:NAD(P)H-dependent oxidoreductase [Myroides injenensis]|uniref:NAD(P)H-dependent oxidoreductase n=1 Tax=Myroides injenensis TaxID=1183151 RepID=UPI00028943DC|nr:NAD(P)H-dependent oxidoreductase [Myroides injenensis]
MTNITLINGHPNSNSLNTTIAEKYIQHAKQLNVEVRYIAIGQLDFNPNLMYGYQQRMELEPDLLRALEDIKWADHLVWIHPLWWTGMPAIMKGFFDRAFLPNITFTHKNGILSKGLLEHKTARIITTAGDLSLDVYKNEYADAGLVQLEKSILNYCGVSPILNTFLGPLNHMTEQEIRAFINTIPSIVEKDLTLLVN